MISAKEKSTAEDVENKMKIKDILMILVFGVILPSWDVYSDIALIFTLYFKCEGELPEVMTMKIHLKKTFSTIHYSIEASVHCCNSPSLSMEHPRCS